MPAPPSDMLPVERDYLMKERATLIDRLTFVEQRLGLPSSVVPKADRERAKLELRMREQLTGRDDR